MHCSLIYGLPSSLQRSMQKGWFWRPLSSIGSRPASTSSPGLENKTTFPSLKGAGKTERATIVCLNVNTDCVLYELFFFFSLLKKLFLVCGKPSGREAETVDREKLRPHRHHWAWVPTRSGFLARTVQSRPRWLRQNHVGPHLRGYRTSHTLLGQLNYN